MCLWLLVIILAPLSPDIVPTILEAAKQLQARDIGYLHLSEADWDDAPVIPEPFRIELREYFTNTIIVACSYTQARVDEMLNKGYADLVRSGVRLLLTLILFHGYNTNNR